MSILIGSSKAKKMFLGTTAVSKIFYGNTKVWPGTTPMYVAVGYATGTVSSIWKSESFNGTWTACGNITGNINTIAYGNGVFVCGGKVNNVNKIYWSKDLTTWTECTGDIYAPNKIVFGNGVFVATVNVQQSCLYSTDGKVWHRTSTPTGYSYPYLAFGNGVFVMANNIEEVGYTIWSTDGSSWTIGMNYKTTYTIGLCYGHDGFATVAYSGYNTYKSTDGKTWSTYSPYPTIRGMIGHDSTVNYYIAASASGTRYQYTSSLGSSWTNGSVPSNLLVNRLTEANGTAFMLCNDGYARAFSSNGWSEKLIAEAGCHLYDIAYGEAEA